MDRLNRRVVAAFAALLALGVALILVGGAGDDRGDEPTDDASPSSVTPHRPPDAADCGIDVPEIPGTSAAPVCALGFGIAIPEGWNGSRLDEESLERLADADLSRPSFLPAARTAAENGAVFYAAGVDADGSVSDLKVDVDDGVDTGKAAIEAEAQALVDSGEVDEARLAEAPGGGTRVDFRGTLSSAETGEELEYHGSHLFVPDGDRLWSLIVTAEDAATRDELVDIFSGSLTFS